MRFIRWLTYECDRPSLNAQSGSPPTAGLVSVLFNGLEDASSFVTGGRVLTSRMINKTGALLSGLVVAVLLYACNTTGHDNPGPNRPSTREDPTIEVTSARQGEAPWMIATSDTVSLTISAPGAKSARLLYRPIVATDRHIVLKAIDSFADKESLQLKLVPDFAGDLWAELEYPDGSTVETKPLQLASEHSDVAASEQTAAAGSAGSSDVNTSSEESSRSDKFTGGTIERAAFQPGQSDIKITVNVPAFHMTLWQNGKEVKMFEIGVGLKKYPIVIGQRRVSQVIWNPEWVPPDSEWVNESHSDVEPGEHVKPEDPRNPLGKIKIPLGDGFLMHEARGPSDIGHLVSHGCIRMLRDDIFELATDIVAARSPEIGKERIDRAMRTTDRLVAKVNPPVVTDINYDTIVVEGGVLHIYPDIYDRGTNTVDNLRAELQSAGVEASSLSDQTLQQLLSNANPKEEFAIGIADIKAGNLLAGSKRPLTSQSVTAKKQIAGGRARRSARGRR